MKSSQKKSILKLNRNKFPDDISRYLHKDPSLSYEQKRPVVSQQLKSWYQDNFQKNNRWNRTLLVSRIKSYSDTELKKLGECFEQLFDIKRQYNQTFMRYLDDFTEQKNGLSSKRLKVDQHTYQEIIKYFGDLRRDGKIQNPNKEIARILKEFLYPDTPLEISTIIDRLQNKKGYYK